MAVFALTGGGTGGHVIPALAVGDVLRSRGHDVFFAGTRTGIEARLAADAGYPMMYIEAGALNRVAIMTKLRTACALPLNVVRAATELRERNTAAVFSMGGFVAGPVMAGAIMKRIPLVIMEPNAIPGVANRFVAKQVYRALIGFEETRVYFPPSRSELTGLPVRAAFFQVRRSAENPQFTILLTGGSRGAKSLNRAARESFSLFRNAGVRVIAQTGERDHKETAEAFARSQCDGEVVQFIRDMPAACSHADLVVSRSGAGAINEIAAAGMPSILVPFPYAADNHQAKNAQVLVRAGAAVLIEDSDLTGERLFAEVLRIRGNTQALANMSSAARKFARPGAAERAAAVLEEAAALTIGKK